MGKVWLVLSGKGGAGKSTVTAVLGQALAQQGKQVCLLDVDIGQRDLDALLGVENRIVYDIVDLCRGDCQLSQALVAVENPKGLFLLPAAQMARSRDLNKKDFQRCLARLKGSFDHILVDCPAGVERGVRGVMNPEVDEPLLVCTPDDMCIRDAERAASILDGKNMPRPRLLVNRLVPRLIARREMYAARAVAQALDLPLLGEVPEDPEVYRCLLRHVSLLSSDCEAASAFERIALRMEGRAIPLPDYGSEARFCLTRLTHRKAKEVRPS